MDSNPFLLHFIELDSAVGSIFICHLLPNYGCQGNYLCQHVPQKSKDSKQCEMDLSLPAKTIWQNCASSPAITILTIYT